MKVKIIRSDSLECLEQRLLNKINEFDNQIMLHEDEIKVEKRTRQNEETLNRLRKGLARSQTGREATHQDLADIRLFVSEIEI